MGYTNLYDKQSRLAAFARNNHDDRSEEARSEREASRDVERRVRKEVTPSVRPKSDAVRRREESINPAYVSRDAAAKRRQIKEKADAYNARKEDRS